MTQLQVLKETLTELKRLEKRINVAIDEQNQYADSGVYQFHKWSAVKRTAIDFKNQLSLITTDKYKNL
jgi:hypothetical protein